MAQHFVHSETDVSRDLPKKNRRDIAAFVEGHGGCAPVWMPELLVRASLPRFLETKGAQHGNDFGRFQDRRPRHD